MKKKRRRRRSVLKREDGRLATTIRSRVKRWWSLRLSSLSPLPNFLIYSLTWKLCDGGKTERRNAHTKRWRKRRKLFDASEKRRYKTSRLRLSVRGRGGTQTAPGSLFSSLLLAAGHHPKTRTQPKRTAFHHTSLLPLLHCLGLFLSFFRSVYLFLFLNKNRNKTKKTKLFLGVWQGKGTNSKPDSGGGGGGLSFRTIRPGRMWNGFFIRAPSSKTLATK